MSGGKRWFTDDYALYEADCRDVLPWWPAGSFDAVVTDPPYGLAEIRTKTVVQALEAWLGGDRWHVPDGKGFMSARWDRFVPPPGVWDECYRVLKPGSWLMAFAAPRTADLMGLSIRLAGFEVQDTIEWVFGSGFPKAKSRLKPAQEPVILAWKPGRTSPPFPGLDGCRVQHASAADLAESQGKNPGRLDLVTSDVYGAGRPQQSVNSDGRWPPNLLLTHHPECEPSGTVRVNGTKPPGGRGAGGQHSTFSPIGAQGKDEMPFYTDADGMETVESTAGCVPGCPVLEMDSQSGKCRSSGHYDRGSVRQGEKDGGASIPINGNTGSTYSDSGGASRFFPAFRYQAKAPKSERPSITLPDGRVIRHSTVKPLELMRWLVRLVCPPGGTVLDPFAGTGPTLLAAQLEGMRSVGTDSWDEACMLACQRLGLDYAAGDREPAA